MSFSTAMEEDMPARHTYDVFLSHAGEQKLNLVDVLRQRMKDAGHHVFVEDSWMQPSPPSGHGDDARPEVLDACRTCDVAIVMLSTGFITRRCPMQELGLLLLRQQRGELRELHIVLYGLQEDCLPNLSHKLCHGDAAYHANWRQLPVWADGVKRLAFSKAGRHALCMRGQGSESQVLGAVLERVLGVHPASEGMRGGLAAAHLSVALSTVPAAGTDLIGWQRELDQAMALLRGQHRCVFLAGPAGTGKTLLARQLAEQMSSRWAAYGEGDSRREPVRFAFEVDLQGTGNATDLKELLALKILPVVQDDGRQWDSMCRWLAAQAPARALIVLENAEQCAHKDLQDAVASLHSLPNVHLIIVSRSPGMILRLPEADQHSLVVQLQPLSTESGIILLEKYLSSSLKMWSSGESLESVRQLVEVVGGVPLVLHVASGLVMRRGATWKVLVEGLLQAAQLAGSMGCNSTRSSSDDCGANGHQLLLVATLQQWMCSCLPEDEQRLLASLAAVGSGFTPGLAAALNQDMEAAGVISALCSLEAAGLLHVQEAPGCPHSLPELQCSSRYVVPRLVREAALQLHGGLVSCGSTASVTLLLLELLESDEGSLAEDSVMGDAAVQQLAQFKCNEGSSFAASAAANSCVAQLAAMTIDDWESVPSAEHHRAVQVELAQQLQEEILPVRAAVLGVDHPSVLRILDLLLATLTKAGEPGDRVCQLQELAVHIRCHSLGPEHDQTVSGKCVLARLLTGLGEVDRAKQLQQEVLALRAGRLGRDHPATLAIMADLAGTLMLAGELAAARKLQEDVVTISVQLLGAVHVETVAAKGKLASILGDMGELQAAKQLAEEVVEARLQSIGPEHPETLACKNNLGVILSNMGQLREARQLQEEVFKVCCKLFGTEHKSTLTSQGNLADTLVGLGQLGMARQLQEEVLASSKRVLGRRHSATLACMSNLASTLCMLGSLGEAKQLLEEVVDSLTCLMGATHLSTLTSKSNLASVLKEQGQLRPARRLQERVLEGCKRALGVDHPLTLTSMNNLADTLRALGELQRARKLDAEVLEVRTRVLGPLHPDTLSSKSNMASTLHGLGKLAEARAMLTEALRELTGVLGPEHPAALACKHNLANTLSCLKLPTQAKPLQEEVVATYGRVLGPEHPDTLASKHNLSLTLAGLGQLSEARKVQQEVLACRMRALGPQHPDTLCSRNLLAAALKKA